MSQGDYGYDSAVAGQANAGLKSTMSSLQGNLDELNGFVQRVCSGWDGDEKEIYQGIQNRWDNAAATIKEILGQVDRALGQTTESVDQMRAKVRGHLQG